MYGVLAACTAYMLLNVALQFLTGHNLYGHGPAPAGELTGPFDKPRAGPPLARLILPVIVPPAAYLLARRRAPGTVAACLLLLVSACLVVVISQRMPTVLTATGMLLSALLLPRLRPVVVIALLAGGLLVGASGHGLAADMEAVGGPVLKPARRLRPEPLRLSIRTLDDDGRAKPSDRARL